ncbi:hypothetical protein IAT38_004757 [Cryptococcus sp. DSM 104549]
MDALRVARVDNIAFQYLLPPSSPDGKPTHQRLTGDIHLTPHHLIFSQTASSTDTTEIWIPYPTITLLTRLPQDIHGLYPLQVETKTFESYTILFTRDRDGGAEDVWQSVKDCALKTSVDQLHAFFYRPARRSSAGWGVYNPRAEFARQGLGTRTKAWRFTDVNKDYSFSPTYPSKIVVPSRISDSTLLYAGKYRSKGRIPALTYLHWANSASITRSSQPMVGIKNSRSSQDERLVECVFTSHLFLDTAYASTTAFGATSTNMIIDARPTANAMANVAMGAGTENMENYKLAKKVYLGIDNIHVMRNSLKAIGEVVHDANSRLVPLDRGLLRKSNWLRHISAILDGALIIVRNVHLNASHVLIHCSDGWDRTAQLSAIAQIALDPYYRTLEGFRVLVEKDWLSFGHKFLDRSGHLSSEKYFMATEAEDELEDETGGAHRAAQAFFASVQKQFSGSSHLKEVSPVFHQFLDCVRQLQRQYPNRFQFNEKYLLDIYQHIYSCQFGTFLFNNEQVRSTAHNGSFYMEQTTSIWDHFSAPELQGAHVNRSYDPSFDDPEARFPTSDQGVLLFDPKDVKFWFRLFKRGDEEMNGSPAALAVPQESEIPAAYHNVQTSDVAKAEGPHHRAFPKQQSALPPSLPSVDMSPNQAKAWNWSHLSGGAFSAVQSAAREIRNISQDALAQLKAEAGELESDNWRQDSRGRHSESRVQSTDERGQTSAIESRIQVLHTQVLGVPNSSECSEPNPWDSTPASATAQTGNNPWVVSSGTSARKDDTGPSLSKLSLVDKLNTPPSPRVVAQDTAVAGEKKAWDPLGVL